MLFQHGGDWTGYLLENGEEALDFSANTSPLGLPAGVRQAVIRSLDRADRYPDPQCRILRSELARLHALPAESILCGNGAADLIERLVAALQPKQALITAPSFGEYTRALHAYGCRIQEYTLSETEDFHIGAGILDAVTPGLDLVILCEPGNPTGVTTDRNLLRNLLDRCRVCSCLLLVDECFNLFLNQPEEHSLIREIPGGGLMVLRAFTKFYGMAGLRLGYCLCAETELLPKMSEAGQPWPVSIPAQAAGIAALRENAYADELRRLISEQRPVLTAGLRELGCRVIEGEANYLLFYCKNLHLEQELRKVGILIRSCENYSGLTAGWYRIAARTEEENSRLLAAMKEILQNG